MSRPRRRRQRSRVIYTAPKIAQLRRSVIDFLESNYGHTEFEYGNVFRIGNYRFRIETYHASVLIPYGLAMKFHYRHHNTEKLTGVELLLDNSDARVDVNSFGPSTLKRILAKQKQRLSLCLKR